MELLYEGKAKKVYRSEVPGQLIMEFKDDATAFNGQKRGQIADKGSVNAQMTARIFQWLMEKGVPTHLIHPLDDRRLLVRQLTMIGLEVVVRNGVAGSLSQRTGLPEGTAMDQPVLELYYKNDALGDPLINDDHVRLLHLASPQELEAIRRQAMQINEWLRPFFQARGIWLVDFKLEFGWFEGQLILGDEISPDTCRLWDSQTRERLDKDRFRRDLGGVEEAYQEILKRVMT